jgi:hypothetical protein
MEELLFNYTHPTLKWTKTQTSSLQTTDMSTPQWQLTIASSGHPSPQMNVMTTPEWHTTTPTLATQSLPIATLPIPKWTHLPSSHLANNNIWPTNLINIIRAIKKMPPRKPTSPEFSFKLKNKAAKQNYMVLMHKYKGSLAASLESQQNLTAGYGSEFRNEATLSHLFACHPNWNRMTQILQNGSKWPLPEALVFGNPKGASLQPELFKNLVLKDVHYGYCLPLPLVKATKIPHILIVPMNTQKQKYDQRIRPDRAQGLFDSQPEPQVVIRDIRQQPGHHGQAPPMHVWIMHQADCQLGRHRSPSLPKPPNTGIKD